MRGLILIIIGLLMLSSVYMIHSLDNKEIQKYNLYNENVYEEKINLIQKENKQTKVQIEEKPIITVKNSHIIKRNNKIENYENNEKILNEKILKI